MRMTVELERRLNQMCNLSDLVVEEAMERGMNLGIERGMAGICELNGSKLIKKKGERKFTLRIKPAGDEIEAYVNQDFGKAIQSTNNQGILGEWILRKVFQLPKGEPLTRERLNELEINGIRLTKADEHMIELEFIWIDKNNLPKDYWK